MAKFNDRIDGFACGNDLDIERTIGGIEAGETLAIAWLYVKRTLADADVDALFSKRITSSATAAGQITNIGSSTVNGVVLFHLTRADTAKLVDGKFFEIRVQETISGRQYSTNIGSIRGDASIIVSAT